MKNSITINYPEALAFSLKMEKEEFSNTMKTLSLIKLYELGKISSGFAAKLLNISRIDFLELLGDYKVSYLHQDLDNELETDFLNA